MYVPPCDALAVTDVSAMMQAYRPMGEQFAASGLNGDCAVAFIESTVQPADISHAWHRRIKRGFAFSSTGYAYGNERQIVPAVANRPTMQFPSGKDIPFCTPSDPNQLFEPFRAGDIIRVDVNFSAQSRTGGARVALSIDRPRIRSVPPSLPLGSHAGDEPESYNPHPLSADVGTASASSSNAFVFELNAVDWSVDANAYYYFAISVCAGSTAAGIELTLLQAPTDPLKVVSAAKLLVVGN